MLAYVYNYCLLANMHILLIDLQFKKISKKTILEKIYTMDTQKVDMYIMANSKYFESHQIAIIRDMLLKADESRWMTIQALDLKDPITMLIISLLGGQLGIDRFVLGETGLGLAKLLTCGGLGIWAIVDWFLIMGRAKEINMQKLQMALY